MANRNFNLVQAPETEVKLITGSFVGANGADGTDPQGCILSATRTGEGVYDLVLREGYPGTDGEGNSTVLFRAANVAANAADRAFIAALDVEAKTATVEAYTVSDAADDCDAKRIEILIVVRNSTARR